MLLTLQSAAPIAPIEVGKAAAAGTAVTVPVTATTGNTVVLMVGARLTGTVQSTFTVSSPGATWTPITFVDDVQNIHQAQLWQGTNVSTGNVSITSTVTTLALWGLAYQVSGLQTITATGAEVGATDTATPSVTMNNTTGSTAFFMGISRNGDLTAAGTGYTIKTNASSFTMSDATTSYVWGATADASPTGATTTMSGTLASAREWIIFGVEAVPSVSYDSAVLADSPLIRFRMDTSTTANTGSLSGTITSTTPTLVSNGIAGSSGYAAYTGTEYAEMATTTSIFGDKTFAVEAWFKTATTDSNDYKTIFRRTTTNAHMLLRVRGTGPNIGAVSPGCLDFYYSNDAGTATTFFSPARYDDNLWHHAVITGDGTNAILYVDGAQVATGALPATPITDTGNIEIGRGAVGTAAEYFQGGLDEVAFYGQTLTAARVSAHYNAAQPVNNTRSVSDTPTVSVTETASVAVNIATTDTPTASVAETTDITVGTVGTGAYSDDFNRANGPLGSNWITHSGTAATIVSNQVNTGTGVSYGKWLSDATTNAQFSEYRYIGAFFHGPAVCMGAFNSSTTQNNIPPMYVASVNTATNIVLRKKPVGSNTYTTLLVITTNIVSGDMVRVEWDGINTLTAKLNGVVVGTYTDPSPITGQRGVGFNLNSATQSGIMFDDWAGGDLVAVASVNASDTGSVAASETASIATASAPTDTPTVSVTDVASVKVNVSTTDTPTSTVTDSAQTVINAAVSAVDSPAVSVADSATLGAQSALADTPTASVADVASVRASQVASDAPTVAVSDNATVQVSVATTDTPTASVTDTSAVNAKLTAVDAPTIAVTDTTTSSVSQTVSANDTGSISTAESAQINASQPATDTNSISVGESATVNVSSSTVDTAAISATETATTNVSISTTDSPTISVAESTATKANASGTDSPTISVTDNATVSVQVSTTDAPTVTVSDVGSTGSISNLPGSDTATMVVGDVASVAVTVATTDTPTVAVNDSSSLGGQANKTVSDTASISVTETASIQVTVATTDSPTVAVAETVSVNAQLTTADTVGVHVFENTDTNIYVNAFDSGVVAVVETTTTNAAQQVFDLLSIALDEDAFAGTSQYFVKVWDGTQYVTASLYVWNGEDWREPMAVMTYDGAEWI